jgi:hypothetical protein
MFWVAILTHRDNIRTTIGYDLNRAAKAIKIYLENSLYPVQDVIITLDFEFSKFF